MRLPKVRGTIRRRLLIDYQVNPALMQRHLPAPFRPKLHDGSAIAGMCLIQLGRRPRRFPKAIGLWSDAAHRIAVVWDDETGAREGVYITRRDTGSLMNHLAGGRFCPGQTSTRAFEVIEDERRIALHMQMGRRTTEINIVGHSAEQLPHGSTFSSVGERFGGGFLRERKRLRSR